MPIASTLNQAVELALHFSKFVAKGNKSVEDYGSLLNPLPVFIYHFTSSSQFESPHLHQIIDDGDDVDVLLCVLPHLVASGLRLDLWKLGLPIPQKTFFHAKHLRHLLGRVI